MSHKLNLVGHKYGRWLVICEAGRTKGKNMLWKCRCDCGTESLIAGNTLRTGKSKSCGCLARERVSEVCTTHGKSQSIEYKIWVNMKQRCLNKKNTDYRYYGGRGITVCERWLKFENFFEDMGELPHPLLTIERMNNNKNYSPSNCIWATRKIQNRNQGKRKDNTTGFKGINYHKRDRRYQAYIAVKSKQIHLGYFSQLEDAIIARRIGEAKYWGVSDLGVEEK